MSLIDQVARLGSAAIDLVTGLGKAGLMLWGAIAHRPRIRKGTPLLIKQLYVVGVQSMVIILVRSEEHTSELQSPD